MHTRPLWLKQVNQDLQRHEGFREYAYPDPLSRLFRMYNKERWGFVPAGPILARIGKSHILGVPWTVGFGFTHRVTPNTRITKRAAEDLLDKLIFDHLPVLDKVIPNWRRLPLFAQSVVINMAFNMGNRLLQFKNSMSLIAQGNYEQAAQNLRRSLWYKQTGRRAEELCTRLERQTIAREHIVR